MTERRDVIEERRLERRAELLRVWNDFESFLRRQDGDPLSRDWTPDPDLEIARQRLMEAAFWARKAFGDFC